MSTPASGVPLLALVTVPVSVPTGPRGDAETAANASRRPSPQTLLLAGVPPHWESGVSTAVWSRIALVWAMSRSIDGAADHIRATVAATCGDAIEVPLKAA